MGRHSTQVRVIQADSAADSATTLSHSLSLSRATRGALSFSRLLRRVRATICRLVGSISARDLFQKILSCQSRPIDHPSLFLIITKGHQKITRKKSLRNNSLINLSLYLSFSSCLWCWNVRRLTILLQCYLSYSMVLIIVWLLMILNYMIMLSLIYSVSFADTEYYIHNTYIISDIILYE